MSERKHLLNERTRLALLGYFEQWTRDKADSFVRPVLYLRGPKCSGKTCLLLALVQLQQNELTAIEAYTLAEGETPKSSPNFIIDLPGIESDNLVSKSVAVARLTDEVTAIWRMACDFERGPETRFYATKTTPENEINISELSRFEALTPAQAWAKLQEINCDFASVLLRSKSDAQARYATFHVTGDAAQKALEMLERWDEDKDESAIKRMQQTFQGIVDAAPLLYGDFVKDGVITLTLPAWVIDDAFAFGGTWRPQQARLQEATAAIDLESPFDADQSPLPTASDLIQRIAGAIVEAVPIPYGEFLEQGMIKLTLPESVIEDAYAVQAVEQPREATEPEQADFEDNLDKIGQQIDRADNLLASVTNMPNLSPGIHIAGLTNGLQQMREELLQAYQAMGGKEFEK